MRPSESILHFCARWFDVPAAGRLNTASRGRAGPQVRAASPACPQQHSRRKIRPAASELALGGGLGLRGPGREPSVRQQLAEA